jgi:signal transduction histidine kinase
MRTIFTGAAVLLILHAGTHISLLSKESPSTSEIYLPSTLSLIFIYWFGPWIVLPMVYLNSVATSNLWGNPVSEWPTWFLYGLPEVVYPLFSWYLFSKVLKGKYWLPDLRNTLLFLVYGVFIPAATEAISLQSLMLIAGNMPAADLWKNVFTNLLGEFTTTFILTLPFFYYLTPFLAKKGLIEERELGNVTMSTMPTKQFFEISTIFIGIAVLVFFFDFTKYWYLYGFISFLVGMRLGFGPVIITNLFITIIAYFIPRYIMPSLNIYGHGSDLNNFFFTANCMFIFAVLNSRVIADLKIAEAALMEQYSKLERTNKELDKFVYSVSHDLTAPLKSILGLVRISRFSNELEELKLYLDKIEKSVYKLEDFIRQVFDYSRNHRLEIFKEQIDLKELCLEIFENFNLTNDVSGIDLQFELEENVIFQDRNRMKIMLNNLLSNAIKYQKVHGEHIPYIKISSFRRSAKLYISIEDNGQGIQDDQLKKVFQMFYRGSDQSSGPGLGLYIAQETANALEGEVKVASRYGEGSIFTIELPL